MFWSILFVKEMEGVIHIPFDYIWIDSLYKHFINSFYSHFYINLVLNIKHNIQKK